MMMLQEESLQRGEEKMCQTAGTESWFSSGSFAFIETLYLAGKSCSHRAQDAHSAIKNYLMRVLY